MNNKTSGRILLNPAIVIAVLFILATLGYAQSSGPETEQQRDERMKWWREARFGMFICWGPVSLTGKEVGWSRGAPPGAKRAGMKGGRGPTPVEVYDNLYKKWKPDKFDARQWAQVAKEGGMKYIIFLVKHHDGFCLYDSKLTDYKSTGRESAWKVDVMKEIADACHEVGLKLFIYYSQPDWHHPDYLTENHDRYIRYLHGQIRELLTDYGRIDGLWFDNLRPVKPEIAKLWDAENLFKMARSIQPHLIINNRCGLSGDFDTPEQRIGRLQVERPWESCITLGTQWAWKPDDQIKSLKECIDILVTCAGRGGNLALNTNPMPDGRIEPRQVKRFHEIGRWMKKYGESIYGTRGGPLKPGKWGTSTHKGNRIYVHVLNWPGETLSLPSVGKKIAATSVLTGGKADVKQTKDGTTVTIPKQYHQDIDTIVVLELDGTASKIAPVSVEAQQQAAQLPVPETKQDRDKRMKWWREARFGMFIHWGLYAVPAGEWKGKKIGGIGEWIMESADIPVSEYEQFAKKFNPVKFDADQWVRIARNAGMKYIVITSKHHDGFCLWDSKVSDYDIMNASPFKRDILKGLSVACKKHGIRLCFYHSIMDWHHPDAQAPFYPNYNDGSRTNPNFSRYVQNYMKPQLEELITNYGPLGVLWFDGEWIKDWTEPQGKDLYNFLRVLQPDIIINNRVGKGRKGMQGLNKDDQEYAGDFGTPEQQIPSKGLPGIDWESCMTMNNTWGFKSYDHNWKSTEDLLRKLVDIASKGGNFLLNVGPTAKGLIPEPSIERLRLIGAWLKVNGESIYGTTASPLGKVPWGRCTAKPGKLYLHIFDWPADAKLKVPGVKDQTKKAYFLRQKTLELHVTREDKDMVVIDLPIGQDVKGLEATDTVVVLEINQRQLRS